MTQWDSAKQCLTQRGLATEYQRLLSLVHEFAYERRPVTLASGASSDFYIDCRRVTLHPEGAFLTGMLVRSLATQIAPEAQAVGGMTMGADPIATSATVASYTAGHPLLTFYVRKEPKGHGTKRSVEGPKQLTSGTKVVLVEDVVTTGGSTKNAFNLVTEAGLQVEAIIALVDRQEGGATQLSALAPFYSLFTKEDIINHGT